MNSNLWLGFLTEFGITSEDAVTVMDEADKYLQVNVSLLIYTRVPWLSVLFPYSPGLDGSTSPMLESQYVYILKLYSKRGMHILQSLLSLVGSREQYLVRQWNHEPGDCSCKNNDSWDMAVHWVVLKEPSCQNQYCSLIFPYRFLAGLTPHQWQVLSNRWSTATLRTTLLLSITWPRCVPQPPQR